MLRSTPFSLAGTSGAGDLAAAGTTIADAAQIVADITRVKSGTGGVKLPPAVAGVDCMVINKLGGNLNIWPEKATDRINALAAGAALVAATLTGYMLVCYETGLWVAFASALPVPADEPVAEEEPPVDEPVEEPAAA